jgi:hypothetical protein
VGITEILDEPEKSVSEAAKSVLIRVPFLIEQQVYWL